MKNLYSCQAYIGHAAIGLQTPNPHINTSKIFYWLFAWAVVLLFSITGLKAQSVRADKYDYIPSEHVWITGEEWQPNESVTLHLTEEPKIHADTVVNVTADASGYFLIEVYHVEDHDINQNFILTATGSSGVAMAYFRDGPQAANLDQARNGGKSPNGLIVPNNPIDWVNGNAGASNSHYVEGFSIPYRMVVTGLTSGSHYIDIEWDIKHSGANAIDFITTYNRLEPHITQFGHVAEAIDPLFGTMRPLGDLPPFRA